MRTDEPGMQVEEVYTDEFGSGDAIRQLSRVVALIAGGIVAVIGIAAALEVDWGVAEVDGPVVDVAGMTFTPVVAVITVILGLVLLGVAASRVGEGRIALGAILAALGGAILLVDSLDQSWQVVDRHGWLALVVGIVFVISGLLADRGGVERRQRVVRSEVG